MSEDLSTGGRKLPKDKPILIDTEEDYKIVNPLCVYLGKSYADWTSEWFNWLLSADADTYNLGPVVFLNASPASPQEIIGTKTLQEYHSTDIDGCQAKYVNEPNIRIGSDRLQIFEDQAVFVPLQVGYAFADASYLDWGNLDYAELDGLTIDKGNPPDHHQLTINNKPIHVPKGLPMTEFMITTPVFTAVVPDVPYGISMKDFLEEGPNTPGSYPAMVAGYFFMLKFKSGSYWVHSWGGADRDTRGPYFSELLYQIDVLTAATRGRGTK